MADQYHVGGDPEHRRYKTVRGARWRAIEVAALAQQPTAVCDDTGRPLYIAVLSPSPHCRAATEEEVRDYWRECSEP